MSLFVVPMAVAQENTTDLSTVQKTISQGEHCASCGMEILKYPGPKGILWTASGDKQSFCSARALACALLANKTVKKAYVHDAQKTSWTHPEDFAFIDAFNAWYVYKSEKKAVMGPSLAPFATKEAALSFQKKFGGELFQAHELTQTVLGCRQHN